MLFTNEQIQYMRSIGLNYDFDNLTADEWINIEDVIGDKLTLECLDENYKPNEEGMMCYSILDRLP